jgi:prepilin-type processing-associated H-X9-DG protein
LRQIYIAATIYATNNKQSLPFGFYYTPANQFGSPTNAARSPWISWFTTLNRAMDPKASPDITNAWEGVGSRMGYELSKVFRCPGATDFAQQLHYFQNPVAMPHLPLELKNAAVMVSGNGVSKITHSKPATFADLYNDNALFWDTPLFNGAAGYHPVPTFGPPNTNESQGSNGVIATSYIDGGSLRLPLQPELRFRYSDRDLFASKADGDFLRGNQSIYFPTDEQAKTDSYANFPLASFNTDLGNGVNEKLYGNVRFRHQRNTIANVAMADGSVQAVTLNKSRIIEGTRGKSYDTTFTRNMLRTKWPSGFAPSDATLR